MKIIKKFYKDYACGSQTRVSFFEMGLPIVSQDINLDSAHKNTIEEDGKFLSKRKFNLETQKFLEDNKFKEDDSIHF